MANQILNDLKELSQIVGVSSRESKVVKAIKAKVESLADEVKVDPLGNLMVKLNGTIKNGPILLIDAHTDEIGIMVKHINKDGFIYFTKIGGFVDVLFPGQTVVFLPDDESKKLVYGVIGIKPPHITSPTEDKVPKAEDLVVDIGATSVEDVNKLGLTVGSTGTLVGEFRELANNRFVGKAFDDRTGCVVMIETLRRLSKNRPEGTIVFNFASAEEVGARGATTAAFAINPNIALAIENTTAGDTPAVSEQDCPTKLEAGPAITVADASLIVNYKLIEKLKMLAEEKKILWQFRKPTPGGTDAGRIALVRAGIPSAVVSVPCRYIHSPICVLSIKDIEKTCDLVEAFARRFTELV